MNKWDDLTDQERQYEMIACVESLKPAMYIIISNAGENVRSLDYYVDTLVEHAIVFMDDGWEFASVNTDHFKNPGELMKWIMYALTTYYYDEEEEDE